MGGTTISEQAAILRQQWETDPRWAGIERTYSAEDVIRLRGAVVEEQTLARLGATRLWNLLHSQDATHGLGVISDSHAVEMVKAGLQAIYLSGGHTAPGHAPHAYPDHHLHPLHPVHPAPAKVRQINKALLRAGKVAWSEQGAAVPVQERLAPVIADADAGAHGVLNAFELMTAMIEAGAAGVQFEDRLPADRAGGHHGGKVLIPTGQHIKTLNAARLAADVLDVPALIIARTAASGATLLSSDVDERDHEFLTGKRSAEGHYQVRPSLYASVTRALAFAPYADLLWLEASKPDVAEARAFAQIIHSQYPDKMLAYSCEPSCDWNEHLDEAGIQRFQRELAKMGYRFQSVTPAGISALSQSASDDARPDEAPGDGTARTRHEHGRYFDLVTQALAQEAKTEVLEESLETEHFVGHDQVDHHGRLVPAD